MYLASLCDSWGEAWPCEPIRICYPFSHQPTPSSVVQDLHSLEGKPFSKNTGIPLCLDFFTLELATGAMEKTVSQRDENLDSLSRPAVMISEDTGL